MKKIAICLWLVTCVLCVCAQTSVPNFLKMNTPDPLPVGKVAPKLEFKDMSGELVSLEHLKGNVLVLNFWNIGCKGCEQERETLNWLSDSLKNQSVKFISITLNHPIKQREWFDKHPISYQIVGNVDFMGIQGPSFFNYRCMPTTVVIGKDGVVKYNQCGPIIGKEAALAFTKHMIFK
ncbi:TlpA disulfide reductase family protein [Runella sp. SP2]|uniref:TlpA family protein disulfide reductase n=1 Tax=Runella sp. SP2 TaxID=2268026 RepID=UPI000F086D06|nr:TlpA disulfide reductase family protein [Runella sp. SP2]AYQ31491.1 TlpA family protein disulfide reductase [Runella sp. SP2]